MADMESSGDLPPLVESEVPLAKPVGLLLRREEADDRAVNDETQHRDDKDNDDVARVVKLVHLQDPKAGVFSQQKKQCDLWEFFWGTSLLTASFINALDLSKLSVLEIGGGSGLCSLTASLSGADSVRMTDLVEDALRVCAQSAKANELANVSFAKLDWNDMNSVPEEAYDLVIASDVLFYRGTVSPVAQVFARALRPGGIGLLTDPCRCNTDDFISKLDDLGIVAETHLFRPEMLARGRDLGPKAFVNVKKVKLIVFSKPSSNERLQQLSDLDEQIKAALPGFTRPEIEVEMEALGLAINS
mmetsp:Transcript_17584/g.34582  ORF Transcript_17584/g.34582 Transcript_17584/m.34582 type:complete len:302 (+) Transcript_17584:48-953(+)